MMNVVSSRRPRRRRRPSGPQILGAVASGLCVGQFNKLNVTGAGQVRSDAFVSWAELWPLELSQIGEIVALFRPPPATWWR